MTSINWEKIGTEDGLGTFNKEEKVFEIYSPHALSQVIGYTKFFYRRNGPVFFRGQNKNYEGMRPSLLRGSTTLKSMEGRQRKLSSYIKELIKNNIFMKSTEVVAYEPLLQHYGIKTRWLDLVDNVWTALWFASHTAHTTGKSAKYVHYELNKNPFSYISLMNFGKIKKELCRKEITKIKKLCSIDKNKEKIIYEPIYNSYFETESYRIIDLRYMAPSLYRRPHSQHALLACRISFLNDNDMDYQDAVICTLKIETNRVLEWLGDGLLSKKHFMFPPPMYDPGYKLFLEKGFDPPIKELGSLQYIGT